MSGTPAEVASPPPLLGAEGNEILKEFGFEAGEIATLKEEGAFGK
jgi:crotonobetainyl-CoA:carnitine CoA-transferase CaiB-like acyl-CoA transferase